MNDLQVTNIALQTEKKELLSSLLKSCHIPFLSQNSLFYIDDEKEYIAG